RALDGEQRSRRTRDRLVDTRCEPVLLDDFAGAHATLHRHPRHGDPGYHGPAILHHRADVPGGDAKRPSPPAKADATRPAGHEILATFAAGYGMVNPMKPVTRRIAALAASLAGARLPRTARAAAAPP